MTFPALPGHRFAYDRDGTIAAMWTGGVYDPVFDTAACQSLNSDRTYWNYMPDGANRRFTFVFPQARTLTGIYVHGGGYISAPAYTSTDSTSGLDGTWNSLTYSGVNTNYLIPAYRTSIDTVNVTGIKAVRVDANTSRYDFDGRAIYNIHLYGTITGASDRLALWHPTNDVEVTGSHFDLGDIGIGTTGDVTFRVKNMSSTKTANSVALSLNTISDATPAFLTQHTLNYNGGSFGSTATVGNLAAGAISSVCTLRRTTPYTAVVGPYTVRIVATPTSWT